MSKRRHNDNYFDELTPAKAYWGGFLAADGYIGDDIYSRGRKIPPRLVLALAEKDKDHMESFAQAVESIKKPYYVNKNGYGSYRIEIYGSEGLCRALRNTFNVTVNKDQTYQPVDLGSVELNEAFCIGYIDADGSVIWKNGKPHAVQFFGPKGAVTWIKDVIEDRFPPLRGPTKISNLKNGFLHRIEGIRARAIVNYVQQLELPYLRRKWWGEMTA